MMRRAVKITLVIIFIAMVFVFSPLVLGILAQRYSDRFLANENKTLGNVFGIHLSLLEYHRGWFRSNAVLSIENKNSAGKWVSFRKLPVVIKHGPFFKAGDQKILGLGMLSVPSFPLFDGSPYQIRIQDIIHFNSDHAQIAVIDNTVSLLSDGLQVASLAVNMNSDLKASHFNFHADVKGLHFKMPKEALSSDVGDMHFSVDAKYKGNHDWKLIFGVESNANKVAIKKPLPIALNVASFSLVGLHVDTKKMGELLTKVIQLKAASASSQVVPSASWLFLFQQLLVQLVENDTRVYVDGMVLKTPMGHVGLHYNVAFPALPKVHHYFDIATNGVGELDLQVPEWHYLFSNGDQQLTVSDLKYSEDSNTIYDRSSRFHLAAIDLTDFKKQPAQALFSAYGLLYETDLRGSLDDLSQLMDWKAVKLCVVGQCFNSLDGDFKIKHINFQAFRRIAFAVDQLIEFDEAQKIPVTQKWAELAEAYAGLISPKTTIDFSHVMTTHKGPFNLEGRVAWSGLQVKKSSGYDLLLGVLGQSVYDAKLMFPAAYVDDFLAAQPDQVVQASDVNDAAGASEMAVSKKVTLKAQAAGFLQYLLKQGYLKKSGDAYQASLSGRGGVFAVNGVAWKSPE